MVRNERRAKKYRDKLNEAIKKLNIPEIFSSILTIWVEEWASYIYFEPFENYGMIGMKSEVSSDESLEYPISIHNSIISKLKKESEQMNPDVSDVPQEAKVSTFTETYREATLLVKTIPTPYWEKLEIYIENK